MANKVSNKSEAAALLHRERYSERIVPVLEEYVKAQAGGVEYDLDANLALLKLYQFYPKLWNKDIAAQVLVLALMQMPNVDYNLCAYLLTEKAVNEPGMQVLAKMSDLLEKTCFPQFWELLDSPDGSVATAVPGFRAAVRNYVVYVVNLTFQKLSKATLCSLLHVSGAELTSIVKENGWSEDGDQVAIALNPDNQARPKKMADHVRFTQLPKLLAALAPE